MNHQTEFSDPAVSQQLSRFFVVQYAIRPGSLADLGTRLN
jgi:hypothetical protein